MNDSPEVPREPAAVLTPAALQGLVHPIRLRLLDLLHADGPATATALAERIGQSSGVTSYHLRVLGRHGFVVDDPSMGNGRDRWWRAAHRSTSFTFSPDDAGAEESREQAEHLVRLIADNHHRRVLDFVGTLPARSDDERTRPPWVVGGWPLQLTPDEARELRTAISSLAARFRRDPAQSSRPDTVRAHLAVHLIPDDL